MEPQTPNPTVPENEVVPDRIRSLELAIEEQRRDYDFLQNLQSDVKIKTITFLGASLGLLGYLYTTAERGSIQQRLFIPNQIYGMIFYAFGLVMLLAAVTLLMIALYKNHSWQTAYDNNQEDSYLDNYQSYLEYMSKRYLKISINNSKTYEQRRQLLNLSFMPMVLGSIILLLLKTFGG